MTIAGLVMLALVLRIVVRQKSALDGLTVQSARRWAILAVSSAIAATCLKLIPGISPRIASAAHYFSVTLFLTPLVDVLGARNPGHRAWPWFVVIPLVAVLQWPAVTQLISGRADVPIEVATPTILGLLFVLIMGSGNYFGTAHTAACFFGTAGIILYVLPVTEWTMWPSDICATAASGLLLIAALLAQQRLRTMKAAGTPDQLWSDFRDTYGLVWAKRVMDRMNLFAEREDWDVLMTLDGFQSRKRRGTEAVPGERPMAALRWMLKRFATESCMERYTFDAAKTDDD